MIRASNIAFFFPRLLLSLFVIWPLGRILGIFGGSRNRRKVNIAHWEALKHAASYEQWEAAAKALNEHDPRLVEWKTTPGGPYSWDTVQARTALLNEAERKWRSRESRNSGEYRELLMPAQSRDAGYITKPELHSHLWTGTKTAIEEYVAATTRGIKTVRKAEASGVRLDEKNDWFKSRRMVLGRTALFLQGGSIFGLGHLGVMKALFENGLLPEVIVGTQAGALMAVLIGIRTDEELNELFNEFSDEINLDAFNTETTHHDSTKPAGRRVLPERLSRWWRTGKAIDSATLEQCIFDNVGDMTFERAWQISGRSICITIASDAPGTPNMLSWITAPNVLIRTAALAAMEPHPDKCLDLILEKNSRGEIRPWILNDETPAYRDRRRKKGWPGQKPPVWRVQELWSVSHFIISASTPYVVTFSPGTHYWALHRPGTPFARFYHLLDIFCAILRIIILCLVMLLRNRPPIGSGLYAAREEHAIAPQRRCKPIEIVPDTSWKDLTALLRYPSKKEIWYWIRKGEKATWPVIRQLHVRMDVEIELHKKYRGDPEDKPRRTLADLCERLRRRRLEEDEA